MIRELLEEDACMYVLMPVFFLNVVTFCFEGNFSLIGGKSLRIPHQRRSVVQDSDVIIRGKILFSLPK